MRVRVFDSGTVVDLHRLSLPSDTQAHRTHVLRAQLALSVEEQWVPQPAGPDLPS